MPPKQQPSQVFMLVDPEAFDEDSVGGIYATQDAADAAAEQEGMAGFAVKKMDVTTAPKVTKAKATANTKAKATKKATEPEPEPEDDEDDAEEEDEAPPAKKAAPKKAAAAKDDSKKQIPEGKPDALKGAKVIFTGTFDAMDRNTSKATAIKYGAKVITKLEDTDYVILGVKAGPNKIAEIEEKGLETVDEAGFFELLKNGIPADKRKRMDASAAAEPAKKKQKK